jgi:hypothetical protein
MKEKFTNTLRRSIGSLFVLLLILFSGAMTEANASHFRYGSLSWKVDENNPNKIIFKVQQAWRRSAYYGANVGGTVYTDYLYFGDGQWSQIALKVTSVNAAEDWFFGEATIEHVYANGNFEAYFSSCCRISGISNASGSWRVETQVNVGMENSSPVATVPPIMAVQTGLSNATVAVPVTDPDGDNIRYRLPQAGETVGINFSGYKVDPNTGIVTFDTRNKYVGSLHAMAVVAEDLDANGQVQSKVIVDFLIRISQQSTPPAFDYSQAPVNNYVYQVSPGQNVNFKITASDSDPGSTVNVSAVGLPAGASFSPASGNPATASFDWTPTAADMGTSVISFTAQDNNGVQTQTSVSIVVSLKPVFDTPPSPVAGQHIIVEPGTPIQYTLQASDPDPNDQVRIISATNMQTGARLNPALPTAAGNPVQTQFNWTPTADQWGHHHLYVTAEDSYGDRTNFEVKMLINTTPEFTSTPVTDATVGEPFSYTIAVNDPDLAYGDALTILASIPLPGWLTLTDNGDGTATLSGTPTSADAGDVTITLQAEDSNHHANVGGMPIQSFTLTVNNCVVEAKAKDVVLPLAADGTVSFTAEDINDGSTASCGIASMSLDVTSLGCENIGENVVILTVTDNSGNSSTASATVTVEDPIAPAVLVKNVTVQLDENGSASITTADIDNGSSDNCGIASLALDQTSFDCSHVGDNTVTLTVTDIHGNETSNTAVVTVINDMPEITAMSVSSELSLVNTEVNLSATYADVNFAEATIDWGDGTHTTATAQDGAISGAHVYEAVGIYEVTLTVTDICGEEATAVHNYVVVYDPEAGFVTGGGWFSSPNGAYASSSSSLKASLSGNAKYLKRNSRLPSLQGNITFTLHDSKKKGDSPALKFKSSSLSWLVVTEYKAYIRGTGTIDGKGEYDFLVSVIDGKWRGEKTDYARIQISDVAGNVIYDNQLEAPMPSEATLDFKGSIVIHKQGAQAKVANNTKGNLSNDNLYPNPARDYVNIKGEFDKKGKMAIVIRDYQTARVYNVPKQAYNVKSEEIYLDLSSFRLKAGYYIIQVKSRGQLSTFKLKIQ